MKRYLFLFLVLIVSLNNTFAQDCEEAMKEGRDVFNKKAYSEALEYFKYVRDSKHCVDKPADITRLISECESKIKEAADKAKREQQEAQQKAQERNRVETQQTLPPEPQITVPEKPQTTLTVSQKNFTFDASGDQVFTVNISTNAPNWEINGKITWCSVTKPTPSSLRLVCEPNTSETMRNSSFNIVADNVSERIDVRQNPAEDPVALGNKFYREEKYDEARRLYMRGDEKGDAEAQYRLGKMYLKGTGVVINPTRAMMYFRKSAANEYSRGENAVGYMYETEKNPNYEEAVKWYRKSAEKGYAPAQYNLGLMYQYGLGVKKNKGEAQRWFRKSADQGLTIAQKFLE